jgi:N-sulfoglucosamine sulfohydrolase
MKNLIHTAVIITAGLSACQQEEKQEIIPDLSDISFDYQPNVVWFSTEDISCLINPYGDNTVPTPNLNRLANEGITFENAFTVCGVCAPSRHSIITGMYPSTTGGNYMRTWDRKVPEDFTFWISLFRKAGYYCTNNAKTDYNFTEPDNASLWDDCNKTAHWINRKKDQPFFAVFNDHVTHESMMWNNKGDAYTVIKDSVPLPPYFPDDPIIRKDVARVYSNIMDMDLHVGVILRQLEQAGLMDSTIFVFWSDHGGPLPRQKREIYDAGTKVPLIIRLPGGKFAKAKMDDIVTLMDLGPTMLSLCGIKPPKDVHAKAFMGKYKTATREYFFAARDRMGAAYDIVRATRDKRYLYIRNYEPGKSPHYYIGYRAGMDMYNRMLELKEQNKLNQEQMIWFAENKLTEELYDTWNDPFQLNNIAGLPANDSILARLREQHEKWFIEIKDIGLIPEAEVFALQEQFKKTIYQIIREQDYPMQKIRETAILNEKGPEAIPELEKALSDTMATIRFWAARGLGRLGKAAQNSIPLLQKAIRDNNPIVRIAAGYALYQLGEKQVGYQVVKKELSSEHYFVRMMAPDYISRMMPEAKDALAVLGKISKEKGYTGKAADLAIRKINAQ